MTEADEMTPKKHDHEERKRSGATTGGEETPRPKVRVTDRRRFTAEDQVDDTTAVDESTAADGSTGGADDTIDVDPVELDPADLARAEAAEYREHLLRLQAEFDNFRKRTMRQQTDQLERASEPLLRKLLEVLDEFDLALMAADRTADHEQFLRGVELVYAKLRDILEAEGLQRIDAEGKPFDPELHEALMHSEGDGDGELVVDDIFRQGYTLKGRVIRPAGVRVGRK
jgi:molecular chaperone GrpE